MRSWLENCSAKNNAFNQTDPLERTQCLTFQPVSALVALIPDLLYFLRLKHVLLKFSVDFSTKRPEWYKPGFDIIRKWMVNK